MHSRIYQVSEKKIKKDDWLTEEDFYDNGFIDSIADYVADRNEDERMEDIDWLKDYISKSFEFIGTKNNIKIKVRENGRQIYFKDKFETFKNIAETMTLEDFCQEFCEDLKLRRIKELIDDEYSFYIYQNGCYQTLDDFVRNVVDGDEFYIGGTLNYHM